MTIEMPKQRTPFLAILLLLAVAAALYAYFHFDAARDAAAHSAADLSTCRVLLADLSQQRAGDATPAEDEPELNRALRSAATVAGVGDRLVSIEPGQPTSLRDSDFSETPVYLRLRAATLRQLVTFLLNLSGSTSGMRPKSIELSPPAVPASEVIGSEEERWTADVTLALLSYTPRPQTAAPPP
jgi:hypothetical protein